jgi:hypothetical protein
MYEVVPKWHFFGILVHCVRGACGLAIAPKRLKLGSHHSETSLKLLHDNRMMKVKFSKIFGVIWRKSVILRHVRQLSECEISNAKNLDVTYYKRNVEAILVTIL